jgi:hypothetical protein
VERFLQFVPIENHTGESLAKVLLSTLEHFEIDIGYCRGQSYDNASNMSGIYNGMQAFISKKNNLAVYIPCAAHSLNLAGKSAVDCCPLAIQFFDFVQKLYVLFSQSTHRWKVLTDALSGTPVVKRVCDTRWYAHADATKAVHRGYSSIKNALEVLQDDNMQKPETCLEAKGLVLNMEKLETGIMASLWDEVLQRFNTISIMLQDPKVDLNTAYSVLDSLIQFTELQRSRFSFFEQEGKDLTGNTLYQEKCRKRKRNTQLDNYVALDFAGSSANSVVEAGTDRFRVDTFLPILDKLVAALKIRRDAYSKISSKFAFLRKLCQLSPEEIAKSAKILVESYPDDLDQGLSGELLFFTTILRAEFTSKGEYGNLKQNAAPELWMYHVAMMDNVALSNSIPNVVTMLSIYLSLMMTNCSGERSFSVLKRVKNYLRASMGQQRMSNLALLSIESELLELLDIDDIISDFAKLKSRKVAM